VHLVATVIRNLLEKGNVVLVPPCPIIILGEWVLAPELEAVWYPIRAGIMASLDFIASIIALIPRSDRTTIPGGNLEGLVVATVIDSHVGLEWVVFCAFIGS
jgi:hypothetical protein